MATVTRTVEINDLTPHELAIAFTDMDDTQQAQFFAEIWRIAKAWPGAGWCQQSYAIVQKLDQDGREALDTFYAHFVPEPDEAGYPLPSSHDVSGGL